MHWKTLLKHRQSICLRRHECTHSFVQRCIWRRIMTQQPCGKWKFAGGLKRKFPTANLRFSAVHLMTFSLDSKLSHCSILIWKFFIISFAFNTNEHRSLPERRECVNFFKTRKKTDKNFIFGCAPYTDLYVPYWENIRARSEATRQKDNVKWGRKSMNQRSWTWFWKMTNFSAWGRTMRM